MNRRRTFLAVAAIGLSTAVVVPTAASAHEADPVKVAAKTDCLSAAGLAKPAKGTRLSAADKAKIKDALTACGVTVPERGPRPDGGRKGHRGHRKGAPAPAAG